eukprot:1212986-Rhodomonas_salina.2
MNTCEAAVVSLSLENPGCGKNRGMQKHTWVPGYTCTRYPGWGTRVPGYPGYPEVVGGYRDGHTLALSLSVSVNFGPRLNIQHSRVNTGYPGTCNDLRRVTIGPYTAFRGAPFHGCKARLGGKHRVNSAHPSQLSENDFKVEAGY